MATTDPVRPPASPSTTGDVPLSSVPDNTRQSTSFHQSRLKLFGLVGFVVSATFWVKDLVTRLAEGHSIQECSGDPWRMGHGVATLALLGIFLATKHNKHCSQSSIRIFDVVTLVVACAGFVLSLFGQVPKNPFAMVVLGTLITGVILMTRAIIVPTTARAAILVNTLACLPILLLAGHVTFTYGDQAPAGEPLASTVIWTLTFVGLATIASRIFHGLRERVREARQLGQYTLEEKIGEGGMGQVYRARHAMLRRPTAVKLLPPGKVSGRQLARFEREVQRTAELTHPNTISVFDYGRTPDNVFYYAMELLDGRNLEELVNDDGPQPPERVIHILRQACGALAEAHDQGLIHRDVKPANLFLCRRGGEHDVVKVLDFGLVKEVTREGGSETIGDVNTITGTPAYMPPEAITSSEGVDARSDIYALGAVGYFLLTGEPVFSGSSAVEICAAHLHQTPEAPSERLGKDLPEDLVRAIMACLEKAPTDRPASARELREALETCADAHGWNEARAAARWEDAEAVSSGPRATRQTSPQTLDIDFDRRLATA